MSGCKYCGSHGNHIEGENNIIDFWNLKVWIDSYIDGTAELVAWEGESGVIGGVAIVACPMCGRSFELEGSCDG